MGRVEKRMDRRLRGRERIRRILTALTLLVVALGLFLRFGRDAGFSARPLAQPTATPVAAAFDETVVTREVAMDAQVWYAIQTGLFSTKEAAEEKAALYTDRGAPGYVCRDGEKWRVYIACYESREDASAVRERLSLAQGVETHLHVWSCPALTLRVSGMAGQVDVAEAGLALMRQAAVQMRDGASRLDGGEITFPQAREQLAVLDGQIRLWQDTLNRRFTQPLPDMVQSLRDTLDTWHNLHAALEDAARSGATAYSAQMKLTAMALFDSMTLLCGEIMHE